MVFSVSRFTTLVTRMGSCQGSAPLNLVLLQCDRPPLITFLAPSYVWTQRRITSAAGLCDPGTAAIKHKFFCTFQCGLTKCSMAKTTELFILVAWELQPCLCSKLLFIWENNSTEDNWNSQVHKLDLVAWQPKTHVVSNCCTNSILPESEYDGCPSYHTYSEPVSVDSFSHKIICIICVQRSKRGFVDQAA